MTVLKSGWIRTPVMFYLKWFRHVNKLIDSELISTIIQRTLQKEHLISFLRLKKVKSDLGES